MPRPSLPSVYNNIDPSKIKLPPGVKYDSEAVRCVSRDCTFVVSCPPLTWFPSISYAKYYDLFVKPWLRQSYQESPPPPFVDAPDSDFTHFLDPYNVAHNEQTRSGVLTLSHTLRRSDVASGPRGRARMDRWLEMTEKAREDFLLNIWETYQRACESIYVYDERFDCPELTLENLAHNGGKGMMKLLVAAITVPLGLPDSEFPLIPNDQWDHLHRVNKYEPRTPLTRPKRAFVQHSLALRHRGLLIFCYRWMLLMDGRPDMKLGNLAPQVLPFNAETAPTMAASSSKSHFAKMQQRAKDFGPNIPHCELCGQREGSGQDVHLLCCSRCKAAPGGGRQIYYCSRDCQKAHYLVHKAYCGKPIGSDPGITSTPLPAAAQNHEAHLKPDSPFVSPEYTGASAAFHPDGRIAFLAAHTRGEKELPLSPEEIWAMCDERDYDKGGWRIVTEEKTYKDEEIHELATELLRKEEEEKRAASIKHEITPEELAAKLAKTKLKGMFGSKE